MTPSAGSRATGPRRLAVTAPTAAAVDALGDRKDAVIDDGMLHMNVSLTPVFVTPEPIL